MPRDSNVPQDRERVRNPPLYPARHHARRSCTGRILTGSRFMAMEADQVKLTKNVAERIAARMRRDGFVCSIDEVQEIYDTGTLASHPGDEALASRVLQEFEEYGVEIS